MYNKTIEDLPDEILLYIFSFFKIDTLNNSVLVSTRWMTLINQSDFLWKRLCASLNECRRLIQKDRQLGKSWQEVYRTNYNTNDVKRRWRNGDMSNPHCYHALPAKPFCRFDDETWGEIFQMELDRC